MTAVQYNHMITHGRSDHDYITKRKMFDLSEPIVVSFDQRENNVKRCFVTKDETSKFVQKPLDKIIASLKQKALDGDITSKLNGLASTFAQHQQKQSSDEDCKPVSAIPTIDLTQTGVASHPHDTVLGKTDLGTEADARQPSDCATALEAQRPSDNTNKGPRAEKRPRVVTVLSPKAGGESPPSRTTLTPKEFAQLLKTCNVTVKSVLRGGSRTEAAVKRVAKQLPRNGALVLRSPWSRGKGSTPLKWHHTNFEPAKGQQKKQQKRPSPPPSQPPCKTVSVTVRKPQVRKSSTQTRPTTVTASTTATVAITPNTSAADADAKLPESTVDHATALSSHALPLTQALSDLASRDLASAETIRETLDCCGGGGGTSDAILPPDSDPFLSDCDLKEAGDIPGDSMAADVSRVRTLPCESDDELIESRDPILSASSNAFTCASRGGCDLKAGSKRSSSVLASFSDRDESWKRFVCDDFLESKNVCKDSKDQPNKDTKQDISNTEEMTQQLDWEQSFFPGSKSSIFDLETNLIFEDLFNVDGGKLLGDEDVTEVLNNSLSFFDMVNDMGSSNCDITPRPQSFDRRHEINNCSPNSDLSQIKYCYQGHTTNTHQQVPYDSMTSHSSTMTLRHDSMTSSCEQQFSNVQTFSDTDSGIHSPGSTPVKSSPPSGTHFGLDDVTGVKREWRSYSCHSDAMSVGDRSATPHSDQEIFYHAAGSPSAFYTNASRVLQEVFTPPSDADTPSPEPAHNLLDLAEPVRAYSVSDRFSSLQFKQQAAVDATIADVIGSSDDVALPVIKSENDYFASVTCERAESPLQNNAHLMVDCPPQPEQQQQQQQQQQQIPSKPKYRHAVGNWQIAVSLKAPNCDDASTAAELEANSRQFAPRLSVLRQDDSSNPYRRRKPRSSHNAKRKQASVVTGNLMTEGQLCCKVRKMTAEKGKAVHLWEFIRNILLDPQHCPTLIKWEDRQQGVFRFMQSDVVASMWGEKKRNPKMTYEKLSRAMRYYYNRGILERVDGRRLVYKFGPNAHGWKAPAVSSDTTGVQLASGASGDQSADDTSTTVHHLCESTGLTIPITKSPLLVPLKIEPAPNPDVLAATVDEETSVVLPQNDSEILQVTSAQDIKPIVSPTSKSPVSSWIIASPTTTVCPLALPSANVLLGKQIKLAVSH